MTNIILNPEEALRNDYEANWIDLVSFEDYLSILSQRVMYDRNQKGNEAAALKNGPWNEDEWNKPLK